MRTMDNDMLVQERERLLSNVTDYYIRDPAAVGIFLGGSVPAGNADAYSDIDLRVVVTSDEHARFVANRLEIPKKWDGFLFNEWVEGTAHCVTHFRSFVKIDVFYLSLADFRPSPWYSLPTEVRYDPKGVLKDVIAQSRNLPFKPSLEEIDRSISKGLASAHEAYRRIRRGELIFAQSLLDSIRHYMVQADDWRYNRPPQAVTFSRLEQRASISMVQAFRESYTCDDSRSIEKALVKLLRTYRRQIIELHDQFPLKRSMENDLYAVDILLGDDCRGD